MKSAHSQMIVAGLLATFAAAATAQATLSPTNPAPIGVREGHGWPDHGRMQERMAQRQTDLKQKLQLAPAQESAWTSFVTAMKESSANLVRPDRAALEKLSTPDRIDQRRALRNQRIAKMDRRGEATKAFYASLTTDQKKVFDAETARGFRGRHERHGHHGAEKHGS